YASTRPWVQLVELESEHGLRDVMELIWAAVREFCDL
ncbi:MAG: esterase, partial [Moorea sp. SIO4G2]|nr:esterase [Moorena sp. SIO4G2]